MNNLFSRLLLVGLIFLAFTTAIAQEAEPNIHWMNLDKNIDRYPGISVERAYEGLLQGKEGKAVVVAVIDSGVDVEHEDLKESIWVNEDEIPDNGIDDDGNGYVDDVHGWNFIGGKEGDVEFDNLEFTRIYIDLNERFKGKTKDDIQSEEKEDFALYLSFKTQYEQRVKTAEDSKTEYQNILLFYNMSVKAVKEVLGKKEFTVENIAALPEGDERFEAMKELSILGLENNLKNDLKEGLKHFDEQLDYMYNLNFDSRKIVGDNYEDKTERYYGNNHYEGPSADHGTHVAGIIAGNRNNDLGMMGIADHAQIMVLRAVPNGDERDKDVANAIRYAVDNGAKVINMSFGKSYSPDKSLVDEAVAYAEEKGVLMVHAAGNSSKNTDVSNNFPNPINEETREACTTWIEVGASNWTEGAELPASFSNYGKRSVDVFAPGVDIYSTVPNDEYEENSGTSMAAPVVSGLAALIMSYYPELSAKDVKEIIVNSYADYRRERVIVPGGKKKKRFKKLSKTGGVVNAYNALRMAKDYQASTDAKKGG
jgi:subtilisin family serine protease